MQRENIIFLDVPLRFLVAKAKLFYLLALASLFFGANVIDRPWDWQSENYDLAGTPASRPMVVVEQNGVTVWYNIIFTTES